eukprot:m.1218351 g.1218351  ORF g.1218351 m.1218351 type:complete len:542 (-) comp24619_c0_seq12:5229-6854(-)
MGGSKSKISIGPEKRWCWGELSTKFAADILMHPLANTGDFLVRNSRQLNGSYCISVRAEAGKVKHFPVHENNEGYYVIQPEWVCGTQFSFIEFSKGTGMSSHKFDSMQDLLQGLLYGGKHAKTAFKHFGCFLIRCVPKGEAGAAATARGAGVGQRHGRPADINENKPSKKKHSSRKVSAPPTMFSAAPVLTKSKSIDEEHVSGAASSVCTPKIHPLSTAPRERGVHDGENSATSPKIESSETKKLPPSDTGAFIRKGKSNIKRGATSFAVGSTRTSNVPNSMQQEDFASKSIESIAEHQPFSRRPRSCSVDTGTKQRYVNVITVMNHTGADATDAVHYQRDQPPTPPAEDELPGQRINFNQSMYDKHRKEQARLRSFGRSDPLHDNAVSKPEAGSGDTSTLGTYETKPFPEYDKANHDHDDAPYDKCPSDWAGGNDDNAYATMTAVNIPTTYVKNQTFDRGTERIAAAGLPRYVNIIPGATVATDAGARGAIVYDNGDAFAGASATTHVANHSVGEYDRAVDGMVDMSKHKHLEDDELGFC